MRKRYMTKFGLNEGNCLDACVASILECDIEDLPGLSDLGKFWFWKTIEILSLRGYGCIYVPKEILSSVIVSDCICIALFSTDSPERHAKVGRWKSYKEEDGNWSYTVEEEFDPHPNPDFDCIDLTGIFLIFPKPEYASNVLPNWKVARS